MSLAYPTDQADTYESQQFGPAIPSAAGYQSQPTMYGAGSSVAWWQPYKDWPLYEHYHNGLDIAGPEGKPLLAMESGKVTHAGWRYNGGGIVVEVEIRPGTRYTFNHCSSVLVAVGDSVRKGQALARIGATGVVTGNHTHISLDIAETGADGGRRELMWNPKLWMSGGAYANDGRIAPIAPLRGGRLNGPGINVRSSPGGALYATSIPGAIVRVSDGRRFSLRYVRNAKNPVKGPWHGIAPYPDQWVPWTLGRGWRYVARPLFTYTR